MSKLKVFLGGHNAFVPLVKGRNLSYKDSLEDSGFEVVKNPQEAEVAVFIEMDKNQLRKMKLEIPTIFVRNEPRVVWPENYARFNYGKIDQIIDVGRHNSNFLEFIPWPQDYSQLNVSQNKSSVRNNHILMISGNKLSFIPEELYTLRRQCVYLISDLDLYGTGWNLNNFRKLLILVVELYKALKFGIKPLKKSVSRWFKFPTNYLGAPESKVEISRAYKYALVIENSIDYMTEKIFDAFFAGNIPIYVGPPVSKFHIPKKLVVQVEPNIESILTGIERAKKIDYDCWLEDLHSWLTDSETINFWAAENVYKKIVSKVLLSINSSKN